MRENARVSEYEQELVAIVRGLPPDQVSQVIDFARFLELKISRKADGLPEYREEEETVAEENAQ